MVMLNNDTLGKSSGSFHLLFLFLFKLLAKHILVLIIPPNYITDSRLMNLEYVVMAQGEKCFSSLITLGKRKTDVLASPLQLFFITLSGTIIW